MRETRQDLEREAELRAYAVLDAHRIPALERVVDLAASICGMAVAEVNVITSDDVVHVATTNRDYLRVPREHSFCSPVISYDVENYVVRDATQEEPFASSPYVTGEKASIRSYASARMTAPNGVVLGNLCVFDSVVRTVDESQLASLRHLAAMVVDIFEMRRSERELAGAVSRLAGSHRELNTSNESLEAFAGQISHDLQSPLTTVELALELLEDEVALSETGLTLLEFARSGGRRMQQSITDLLDFAVAGSGSPAVRVDVAAVTRSVLADLAVGLEDVEVEVGALPDVLGHETELRAVLQNLVANAVKFASPFGSPYVRVEGVVGGTTARISVIDNGPGIPEAERTAVFGLNVRGSSTSAPGHGIGLATCARLIGARGGRIGVDGVAGGGSEFWFELPAAG
ncbi:MAG: ATP-binding protein [Propionibacteriales bacterium]|nr:ATP-binding protein [Propionibacteriales bacterium]